MKRVEWCPQIVGNPADEGQLLLPLPSERLGHVIEGDANLADLARTVLRCPHFPVAAGKPTDGFNNNDQRLKGAAP